MTKNTAIQNAKKSVVDAAKTGTEQLKDVATEALGAAAAAAAGVVMDRVAEALGAGEKRADAGASEAARQISAQPFMSKNADGEGKQQPDPKPSKKKPKNKSTGTTRVNKR
jgi:hypothetical protein